MSDFIRARTMEQFNQRRQMILDACDEIYNKDGFLGVTFNTVAAKTSFTRPALYNYYKTREEMLMDLLQRRLETWKKQVLDALSEHEFMSREEFCRVISNSASTSERLFQLIGDVFMIEQGCEAEDIKELITTLHSMLDFLGKYVDKCFPGNTKEDIVNFLRNCTILIFGLYPYTHMHPKRVEALNMAVPNHIMPDMQEMLYCALMNATAGLLKN